MSYLYVVLLINIALILHEAGHFLAARACGIPIESFSIGMGRRLFGFKRFGTDFCVSLVPLGGYVLPAIADEKDWFNIPLKHRVFFTLAGPLANFLLLPLFFIALNFTQGASGAPLAQSAAAVADFVRSLPAVFKHADQLSGPVGIVALGGALAAKGLAPLLKLGIMLNLNFGVLNLLPLPPLDGGKLSLYLLEKIHPKLKRLHMPASLAGWALMACFFVWVTFADLHRLFAA